ncbi:MAG: hypothetical protein GWP91_23950, partial [Rhodobacterales bacterium]|nr:hypothetical protein [Rhodobacterales bacterium]
MKNPSRLLLVAPSIAIILACSGATTDLFGTCELPPEREAKSGAQRVAPVNPGAAAGFDSVDAQFDIVDDFFPEVTGCSDIHTQSLTHAPGNRIDDAMGDPYRHIDTMTFVPNDGSVATGDLFLHGDGKGYLSIRDVDLRKFLYQDVILADCDKQKCDKQTLQGDSSDWKHAESAPRSYAGEPFNSDRSSCIRNVHGFFAEFNRIAKKIPEYGGSGDLRLHLTNNCREPGNYEFALVSEKDGKLYKDHVSLDIEFYSKILEEIDVELDDLGTGIRVVGTERRKDGSYVYEDVKQKAFPAECGLVNLAPYIGKPQRLITKSP